MALEEDPLGRPAAKLIGFVFDRAGRHPDPEKLRLLREWPAPTEMADVVSLECFANYLREFIPDFDVIRTPLAPYRKKGAL